MKKIILSISSLPVMVFAGTSIQVNYLCITSKSFSSRISDVFQLASCVTAGQPGQGSLLSISATNGCLQFMAGRKASAYPLNCAQAMSINNNQVNLIDNPNASTLTYQKTPKALNFSFVALVIFTSQNGKINYACNDLVIGQANSGSNNYWGIGNNSPVLKPHQVICESFNNYNEDLGAVVFNVSPGGNNYTFKFELVNPGS